ncbi:hypothetical protein [Cupriavidus basilensis]
MLQNANYVKHAEGIHAVSDSLIIRESEIPARTTDIENAVTDLHNTIEQLLSRLDVLLLPPGDTGTNECGAEPSRTEYGSRLTALRDSTRRADARLRDILGRLEV